MLFTANGLQSGAGSERAEDLGHSYSTFLLKQRH